MQEYSSQHGGSTLQRRKRGKEEKHRRVEEADYSMIIPRKTAATQLVFPACQHGNKTHVTSTSEEGNITRHHTLDLARGFDSAAHERLYATARQVHTFSVYPCLEQTSFQHNRWRSAP